MKHEINAKDLFVTYKQSSYPICVPLLTYRLLKELGLPVLVTNLNNVCYCDVGICFRAMLQQKFGEAIELILKPREGGK